MNQEEKRYSTVSHKETVEGYENRCMEITEALNRGFNEIHNVLMGNLGEWKDHNEYIPNMADAVNHFKEAAEDANVFRCDFSMPSCLPPLSRLCIEEIRMYFWLVEKVSDEMYYPPFVKMMMKNAAESIRKTIRLSVGCIIGNATTQEMDALDKFYNIKDSIYPFEFADSVIDARQYIQACGCDNRKISKESERDLLSNLHADVQNLLRHIAELHDNFEWERLYNLKKYVAKTKNAFREKAPECEKILDFVTRFSHELEWTGVSYEDGPTIDYAHCECMVPAKEEVKTDIENELIGTTLLFVGGMLEDATKKYKRCVLEAIENGTLEKYREDFDETEDNFSKSMTLSMKEACDKNGVLEGYRLVVSLCNAMSDFREYVNHKEKCQSCNESKEYDLAGRINDCLRKLSHATRKMKESGNEEDAKIVISLAKKETSDIPSCLETKVFLEESIDVFNKTASGFDPICVEACKMDCKQN